MSADGAPRITGLSHIAIAVANADEVAATFVAALGATRGAEELLDGDTLRVVFLHAGPVTIELLEPRSPDHTVAKFLAVRGPGLHHVSFEVPELDAALARAKETGVRLIDETPRAGAHGTRVAFVHPKSLGGVLVELCEGQPHRHLEALLDSYATQFENGEFTFRRADNLRETIQRASVPARFGVYLIYGESRDRSELLYVGKSGTLKADGKFARQTLPERLQAKQDKKGREEYYRELLSDSEFDSLRFRWFATWTEDVRLLPLRAEAALLESHFLAYGRLPRLNRSA
jgi:methylmalonyl-CoA/ethylmalonyl-CoA epimerase